MHSNIFKSFRLLAKPESSNNPHLSIPPRLSFFRHHHHHHQSTVCLSPASPQAQALLHTTSKPKDLNATHAMMEQQIRFTPPPAPRGKGRTSRMAMDEATARNNALCMHAEASEVRFCYINVQHKAHTIPCRSFWPLFW